MGYLSPGIGPNADAGRVVRTTDGTALLRTNILMAVAEAVGRALLGAVLTQLGITAKELGAFDRAAQHYARLRQLYDETGATPAEFAALRRNLART